MSINDIHSLKGRRVLIAASGSIAAVKTPLLVSALIQAGASVKCVVTPSASNLVSPLALATLSRHRCYQDADQWSSTQSRPLHIALAEWAEIIVVAPLSASSLARWTQGLADGLLASLLLASECPIIAAPAMNTGMWENLSVQKNWKNLVSNPQVLALTPSSGLLACDRLGDGRMIAIEVIQIAIASGLLNKDKHGLIQHDWVGKKLLVTSGPTIEALDPARLITNRSSGRMGVLLAQAASFRGAKVDLVHGPLQIPQSWLEGLKTHAVKDFAGMKQCLESLQPTVDAVVMAAAVADLRKKGGALSQKLRKESLLKSMQDGFEPVPDLLREVTKKRSKGQIILGFAALTGNDKEITKLGEEKRVRKGCDLLMANPIDRDGQGFEVNTNGGVLLGPQGMVQSIPITSKLALANQLLSALMAQQNVVSQKN